MITLTDEERKKLAATSEERFQRDREEMEADLKALQKMLEADVRRFTEKKSSRPQKIKK